MKEKAKNRIGSWIPGWNLHSVIESEKIECHMNGWSLPKVKNAV